MNVNKENTYELKLSELRIQLNAIDEDLIKLLILRFSLTNEIGILKQTNNQPIYDQLRESSIIQNLSNSIRMNRHYSNDQDMLVSCITDIYKEIMNQSKISQSNVTCKK